MKNESEFILKAKAVLPSLFRNYVVCFSKIRNANLSILCG